MAQRYGPKVVNDELKLCIDAAVSRSYGGSGTTINNLVTNINNPITMVASTTWSSDGYWSFDGSGEPDGNPTGSYLTGFGGAGGLCSTDQYANGATYTWWSRVTDNTYAGQAFLYGSSTIAHVEFKSLNDTTPYFRTEASRDNGYSFGSGNIPGGSLLNRWANFALVFDNSASPRTVKWYHNGSLFHTHSNFDSGDFTTTEYFYLNHLCRATGTANYSYNYSFAGDVANFSFFGKALNADEVAQNFEVLRSRLGV